MQQPIPRSDVTIASTTFDQETPLSRLVVSRARRDCVGSSRAFSNRASHARRLNGALITLVALSLLTCHLRAQDAPASAPANPAAQGWITPEKGVQLQLKRPWTPRPDVAGSNVGLYGLDLTLPNPVFTVAEANKRCSWLYNLAIPIDVAKYPIAVMRYRAKNITPKSVYTMRVDSGTDPAGCCRLFSGAELVSDGEVHEAKKDLRDFKVTEPIVLIGIGVQTENDSPATLEVIDIRFDAPDDAPVDSPGEDAPITVSVTDDKDNPIPRARVMVDIERRNFVRPASADGSGQATVTPRKNEADTHMLAVTAPGFTTVEVLKVGGENEPIKVKLSTAKPYGGVAKIDDKPVAGAMVLATVKTEAVEGQQELRSYSTITDEAGRWITPPLPADVEQISLTMSHPDGAGAIAKTDLDANDAQAGAAAVRQELVKTRVVMGTIALGNAKIILPPGGVANRRVVINGVPAAAAAEATTGPADAAAAGVVASRVSPSKSVVIDLTRPFDPHPNFAGNIAAAVYGMSLKSATANLRIVKTPVFTIAQPTKAVVFTYPLALPIDPAKYPFVTLRYRAKNTHPESRYALRVDSGTGDARKILRLFPGSEVKSDGEEHEVKKDMRDESATDPITQLCINVQASAEAAAATLEVLEIRFDAPDDAPVAESGGRDSAIQVTITDADGQPIKDAMAASDPERKNFSRAGISNDKGVAVVMPVKNESGKHSIKVEKNGFMPEEVLEASVENGPVSLKLTPAKTYGGAIKADDKPVANAMVSADVSIKAEAGHRLLAHYTTLTDEKGRWITPELPSDATLVSLKKVTLKDDAPIEEALDSAQAIEGAVAVARELGAERSAGRVAVLGKEGAAREAAAHAANEKMAVAAADAAKAAPPPAPPIQPVKPAGNATTNPYPAPEKAIVLDIHRPWLAGPMWDGNQPPKAYGENLDLPEPRFTVVDANAKSFWLYKPAVPIDLAKYPIVKLRYRATNTHASDGYVMRLVQGDVLQVMKSDEVKADGKIQSYSKDLREVGGQRKLTNIGFWVNAGDKGNATFDLVSLDFAAPDDAPVEKPDKDTAVTVVVTDSNQKPLADVIVTLDAERLNFARTGKTDAEGRVTINARAQEDDLHMVRVVKDGQYPIERRVNTGDSPNVEIQLVPGSRYGGIARGAGNKLLTNAMVIASGTPELDGQTQMPAHSTVLTDSQGRWVTPVLPAIDGLSINITPPDASAAVEVDLARAKQEGADLFAQLQKSMAVASSGAKAAADESAAKPTVAKAEKDKPAPAPGAANIDATILKVDESTIGGKITAMDGKQLTLKTDSGNKQIALPDLQEITLKASSTNAASGDSSTKSGLANAQLELANGDHFKGSIKKWEEKKFTIQLAAASSITLDVPVEQARQLWLGSADQVKKAQALNEKPGVEDIAFVMKDDQAIAVRGISLGVEGDSLKFRFNDQERKIAVNRLVGLTFGRSEDAPVDRQFHQTFQFTGDDTISGTWTGLSKDTADATTLWGAPIKLPVKQLAKIRAANGRMVYLSDLRPTQVEQVPYFDRMLSFRIDKALNGKPLQLTEGPIAKGIAVHSRTVLHYDLGGQFDEFRSKLGFQQPEGKLGQADVRVLGDGKVIFDKPDAKGDQPSTDITAKVAGVKELVLEVDFGKNQDVGDRVVWGNARLLRAQIPQQTNASEGRTP